MKPPRSRAPSALTPRACDGGQGGSQDAAESLVRLTEVCRILGISRAHASRLNVSGRLPRPIRLGRAVRWSTSELGRWIAAGCPTRDQWEAIDSARGGRR